MPAEAPTARMPLLVFSHIEKSAGTSFRALLWRNYGRARVLWYGLDIPFGHALPVDVAEDYDAMGGHFDIPWVDRIQRPVVECAVVRDPVERAISLFHYFAESGPEEVRQRWKKRGLVRDSLGKSLTWCYPFRRAVKNVQCKRLSGSRRFSAVLRRYEAASYVVGSFDWLEIYCRTVGNLFRWQAVSLPQINRAPANYIDRFRDDASTWRRLERMNREDMALMRWLNEEKIRLGGPHVRQLIV